MRNPFKWLSHYGLLLALVILLIAVPVIAADPTTGHHWVDLSETEDGRDMLMSLMRGYIEGYSVGYMLGQTTGAIKAINDLGILTSEQKKEAYAEAIRSAIEKRPKPQVADVSHYVNELTSFFQAFPLCKGRALFDTFSALAPIWTGIARQTLSYQTVGRDCGK